MNINKLAVTIFISLFIFNSIGASEEMTLPEMLFKGVNQQDEKKGYELVQQAIQRGVDPNIKDNTDNTALILAAKNGHKEIAQLLLNAKANPDIKDTFGDSALIYAAKDGHKEIVQLLLNANANPDIQDGDSNTALIRAAYNGKKEIVQLLLDANANPDIQGENGYTALMQAVFNGKKEVVQLLLDAGADIDIKNDKNKTALDIAQQEGTALHIAHKEEYAEIVQILKDEPKKRLFLKKIIHDEACKYLPEVLEKMVSEYVLSRRLLNASTNDKKLL